MDHLPPEILGLTLSLLRKKDLKKARQVSKAWEKAAVPYLFNQVFLSPNFVDLEAAEVVIDHFGFHVKTLTLSIVYYREMNRTTYNQWDNRHASRSLKNVHHGHTNYAYQTYSKVRRDQTELLEKGTCLAHLCKALRRLPHLQKLVLKDLGSRSDWMDNVYSDRLAKSLGPCSVTGCQLSQSEHLEILVQPESGFSYPKFSPWNLAMLAWWAVGNPVRELATESQACLPFAHFFNPVQKPWDFGLLFQSLTKLRLNLSIDPDPEYPEETSCFQQGGISLALSGAKSLQCLYILATLGQNVDEYRPMTPFQTILGTCQFPKLRSLILNSLDSTSEELLTFLEASKQLQQFTLIYHELLSGTWEQTAGWMRTSLTLEEIDLNGLYGGLVPHNPVADFDDEGYIDYFGHVQDFFLRHGPNPFNKDTLSVRKNYLKEGRAATCPDYIKAAEERYRRYH